MSKATAAKTCETGNRDLWPLEFRGWDKRLMKLKRPKARERRPKKRGES